MTERIITDSNGRKHITNEPQLHPPRRTWVGLTPEEIDSLANLKVDGAYLSVPDTIRQADAKLKQKNGYAEEKNNG